MLIPRTMSHDLAVFRLQLFLLQLLEPGLLFTDFGLDLINLGLDFSYFLLLPFKTSIQGNARRRRNETASSWYLSLHS